MLHGRECNAAVSCASLRKPVADACWKVRLVGSDTTAAWNQMNHSGCMPSCTMQSYAKMAKSLLRSFAVSRALSRHLCLLLRVRNRLRNFSGAEEDGLGTDAVALQRAISVVCHRCSRAPRSRSVSHARVRNAISQLHGSR